jgi:HAD superfamily hydrolase (TIGR01549 family)
MIKAISFDLDGCLSDDSFDEQIWRHEIPRIYSEERKLSFEEAYKRVTAEYGRLFRQKEPRWRDVAFWFSHFRLKTDWKHVVDRLKHKIFLYGDVVPVLRQLKGKYKLIVLSTANHKFLDLKLETLKLRGYFDFVFSTEDFREMKKSKEVFNSMLAKLKLKREELVHIGDSPSADYETPKSLGIKSFLIDRSGKEHSEYACRTLYEFLEKVKG